MSVGEALGCREAAVKAAGELRARLGRTAAMALGRPRPRVATLQWVDPCYTAGMEGSVLKWHGSSALLAAHCLDHRTYS